VETLVRRAQRGDAVALDELVRELAPYVGRICGAVALDTADDAMQETMMAIVRGLPTLREPLALRAWARRIAVRESMRMATARLPAPVAEEVLDRLAVGDDADTDAVDVRAVLEALAPQQRAVLVLRHLDGLTEDEMAAALDVAPGTVKSRLHRARTAFRTRWSS
jgi:RNA polymerase sigma-70 factor (ECF subfamily)